MRLKAERHNQSTRQRWIPGYESRYMATIFGDIISIPKKVSMPNGGFKLTKQRILKPGLDQDGYLLVGLSKNNRTKTEKVHRLIAKTYIGQCPDGHITHHIDNNKQNANITNLKYITTRENISLYHETRKTSSKYIGVYWSKQYNMWCSQIHTTAANLIEESIMALVERGEIISFDARSGLMTDQIGDMVVKELQAR